MNRLLEQLRAWYGGLEGPRRQQLWITLAVVLVATIGLSWLATRPVYQPLLSGRTYDELLTAAAALDGQEIPYRVRDNGSLEVQVGDLGAARAAIAAANVLPGLGDVSDLKLGLTPRAQEWAFLRAREGDLARMINGIAEINASQVSIVPREDSLYFGEERPASASVFLQVRPGATLAPHQVQAIVNIVANAVEGLSPKRISVADDQGHLLASGNGTPESDAPRELLEYRTRLESRYEGAVRQSLLPVFGSTGAFSVTASVDLDLTATETVSKSVDVNNQAVLSEQLDESSSNRSDPAGVPGVDANLPERSQGSVSRSSTTDRSATTFNYTYPTVDEIRRRASGGIERVSVAVQVDKAAVDALVEAGAIDNADAFKREIQAAMEAAIGYDADRDDLLSVSILPFAEREWVDETDIAKPPPSLLMTLLPWSIGVVAMLLVFWFVVRPLMRVITGQQAPKQITVDADGNVVSTSGGPAGEGEGEEEDNLADRLRNMVDNFQPVDSNDLNRLVERESVAAAHVLRQWTRGD